jgi:hypothetical protein
MNLLKEGDAVRRRREWDGTAYSGAPTGPVLTVVKAYPCESFVICELSDGRTEFDFNLSQQAMQFATGSKRAC